MENIDALLEKIRLNIVQSLLELERWKNYDFSGWSTGILVILYQSTFKRENNG